MSRKYKYNEDTENHPCHYQVITYRMENTTASPTDSQPEKWISARDAAERLGVGQKTIRLRIQAGKMRGELRDTPTGKAWFVPEAEATDQPTGESGGSRAASSTAVVEARAEADRLREQLQAATYQLGAANARHEEATKLLAAGNTAITTERTRAEVATSRAAFWRTVAVGAIVAGVVAVAVAVLVTFGVVRFG